jgi:hypothetical protein
MQIYKKNVLLISPETFSYSKLIKSELNDQGFSVVHWNSRLNESSLYKICLRVSPVITKKYSEYFYIKRIYSEDIKKFQYVLVIKADGLTEKVIIELKKKYSNAKFALYLWDSIKNLKGIKKIAKQFEYISTFDPIDSKLMGWKYRPLFSSIKIENLNHSSECIYKYDLCFIGTNHSDRLSVINKILDKYRDKYEMYLYIFFQKEWILFVKKFLSKDVRLSDNKILHDNALHYSECMEIICNSRAILDIEHPNQRGLTMRTIEALTSNRKIITTNPTILDSDLFCHSRVEIINRQDPRIRDGFIFEDFTPIPLEILDRYTVKRWFADIFFIKNRELE